MKQSTRLKIWRAYVRTTTALGIAAAALTYVASARADVVWTQANTAGGSINLTNESRGCIAPSRFAYYTNGDRQMSTGCWRYTDGNFEVQWGNGLMLYPGGSMRYRLSSQGTVQ